jgi:hypothetical protein
METNYRFHACPQMPRFFFDTREDDTFIPDDEGMELSNLTAAEQEALEAAASIARHKLPTGEARSITIEVWTEDRRRVIAATVTMHVERDKSRPH